MTIIGAEPDRIGSATDGQRLGLTPSQTRQNYYQNTLHRWNLFSYLFSSLEANLFQLVLHPPGEAPSLTPTCFFSA